MSQIQSGTVQVVSGSASVVASVGSDWNGVVAGDLLAINNVVYTIAGPAVLSGSPLQWSVNLTAPYSGMDDDAAIYAIHTDFEPLLGLPNFAPGDTQAYSILNRAINTIAASIAATGGSLTGEQLYTDANHTQWISPVASQTEALTDDRTGPMADASLYPAGTTFTYFDRFTPDTVAFGRSFAPLAGQTINGATATYKPFGGGGTARFVSDGTSEWTPLDQHVTILRIEDPINPAKRIKFNCTLLTTERELTFTDADAVIGPGAGAGSTPTGARAHNSVDVSIPNSVWTPIPLDTEEYDVGGLHDPVTNNSRFTISVAGTYLFQGSFIFAANATGLRGIAFRKNGTLFLSDAALVPATTIPVAFTTSVFTNFAAGDYVELIAYQGSGGALAITAAANYSPIAGVVKIEAGGTAGTGGGPQNNLDLNVQSADLATVPGAGTMSLYSRSIAGRSLPRWENEQGHHITVQAALFERSPIIWLPISATGGQCIGDDVTSYGTESIPAINSSGTFRAIRRKTFTSATTANQQQGLAATRASIYRSGTDPAGGFFFFARIGFDAYTAGDRLFVGLTAQAAASICTADPSTMLNCVGVGFDAADTSWQFIHNDGSGTATKNNIGGSLATFGALDIYLFMRPNSGTVYVRTDLLSSLATTYDSNIAVDVPAGNTPMRWAAMMGNAANVGAGAAALGVGRIYIDSRF